MAKYIKAKITMPGSMNAGEFAPIDDRYIVENLADLYASGTFGGGNYVYPGLQVYVNATKELYMYIGPLAADGTTAEGYVADHNNWRTLSNGGSTPETMAKNIDDVAAAAGISGSSANNNFGYSAHTEPDFISTQAPTSIQTEVIAVENALTPTTNTDATVTGTSAGDNIHKNIIKVTKDGIEAFADIHYDSTTNTLKFVNTNGYNEIKLTGINFISGASYNAETEQIDIYYQKQGETSASTLSIPVSGIIEEYNYEYAMSGGTAYNTGFTASDHNVSIKTVRNVSGKSEVFGDIDTFDCGTW